MSSKDATDAVFSPFHNMPNRPDLVIPESIAAATWRKHILFGHGGRPMEAAINHVLAIAISVAHKEKAAASEHPRIRAPIGAVGSGGRMPQGVMLNGTCRSRGTDSVALRASPRKYAQRSSGGDPTRAAALFSGSREEHIKGSIRKAITRVSTEPVSMTAPTRPHARNLAQSSLHWAPSSIQGGVIRGL